MPIGMTLADAGADTALSTFITTITGALTSFSTTTLGSVLVAALGITAGLAIAWFAYRFIVRKVSGALKKGKI